ncbi:hypothetical protein [Spirillospora sp. NBC_01491]|uniref:hypothetical protein n=1 Tax=Spirillospora sp. NBC_01491 TaxID=2976007 RepID=UPI002E303562|nr:hypothetical protein [Spirillospora sp. NBC_01491]
MTTTTQRAQRQRVVTQFHRAAQAAHAIADRHHQPTTVQDEAMIHPIHQFTTRRNEDCWEAQPTYKVTEFMACAGCRMTVRADTFADLELVCMVQRIKAGVARASEQLGAEQAQPENTVPAYRSGAAQSQAGS